MTFFKIYISIILTLDLFIKIYKLVKKSDQNDEYSEDIDENIRVKIYS